MRRLPALLALAFALLAAAVAGAPAAHAAKGMEMAVQDDPVFVDGAYYDRERALAQARTLGVTRIRVNVSWWDTVVADQRFLQSPPRAVRYDWSRYDSLIDAAARYGIRVQMTLTGPAPAFANSDRRIGEYGPRADQYGRFVGAAVRHFKRRVNRYSLWNEPNHIGWVQPLDLAAALYRDMYTAGYKAAKRADRRSQVLIGELVPYGSSNAVPPLKFIRDVTCARLTSPGDLRHPPRISPGPCPGLRADGIAVHPYDYKRAPNRPYPSHDSATLGSLGYLTGTLTTLRRIRSLRTPRGGQLPVYLTEFGYFNSGKYKLPQSRRSAYLVRAYRIAQRNKWVRQTLQYSFITPPLGFTGGYFDLSLIDQLGTPMAPYNSLSRWAHTAARKRQIARNRGPIRLPAAPRT